MKIAPLALAALLIAAPCIAMTDTQSAYLQGFQAGMKMMDLYRENVTAYNEQAAKFNASLTANLNDSEAAAFMLPLAAERIAPVPNIFNASMPIEELTKA